MKKVIRLWIYCKICNKQFELKFNEQFQKEFKEKASYLPYPIVFPHQDHFAIIYLDDNFAERGIVISDIKYKGDSLEMELNHFK